LARTSAMRPFLFGPLAMLLLSSSATAQKPRSLSASDWRTDLRFLEHELLTHHPKLFCGPLRQRFEQAVTHLEHRVQNMPRERVIMEIARALALVKDGHTQIDPANDDAIAFHRYPFRLYWYSDGLFIRSVAPDYRVLAGARLIDVGGVPVDTLVHRLRPFIHGDNEMTIRDVLPSRLSLAEVLHTIGGSSTSGKARFRFQRADGTMESIVLEPIPTSVPTSGWVTAQDTSAPLPLYLRNRTRNYWFEYIDSLHTMYAQFNAVANAEDETMATFCSRLFATTDSVAAERLVIDLRLNNGGDNTLNRPCVHGLIRATSVNRPGRLFVIVGRLTFSAAMNLAVDIERNSSAIFVGEPTGASPNHFGETRVLKLPRSGITVLHSTLYWQSSDPRDTRPWIDPTVKASLSSQDYHQNRDPALDAIFAITGRK
jgi:hypothetical protein